MGVQLYSDDDIITALQLSRGLIFRAARLVGCTSRTIYDRVKAVPAVAEALEECRGLFIDDAQHGLAQKVDEGDFQAIALVLKTLGKGRGFVERSEQTGKDGDPLHPRPEVTPEQARQALKELFGD